MIAPLLFVLLLPPSVEGVEVPLLASSNNLLASSNNRVAEICRSHGGADCSAAKDALNFINSETLKIAIVGMSRMGKSTLVNTVAQLVEGTAGAAKICSSDECTGVKTEFNKEGHGHPETTLVRYVDFPGCATEKYPLFPKDWSKACMPSMAFLDGCPYPQRMQLDSYDVIIHVMSALGQFAYQCDVEIFKFAQESLRPLYVVLNHINDVAESYCKTQLKTVKKRAITACLEDKEATDHLVKDIKQKSVHKARYTNNVSLDPAQIFALDARWNDEYDMPQLMQRLTSDLNDLFLEKLELRILLTQKNTEFKAHAVITTVSGATGAVAGMAVFPGVSRIPVGCLQAAMLLTLGRIYKVSLTAQAGIQLTMQMGVQSLAPLIIEELVGFVPIAGQLVKGSSSVGITLAMGYGAKAMFQGDPDELAGKIKDAAISYGFIKENTI